MKSCCHCEKRHECSPQEPAWHFLTSCPEKNIRPGVVRQRGIMSTQVGHTAAPFQAFIWPGMAWDCPAGGEHHKGAPVCQQTSLLYSGESWVAIHFQPVRFEREKGTSSRERALTVMKFWFPPWTAESSFRATACLNTSPFSFILSIFTAKLGGGLSMLKIKIDLILKEKDCVQIAYYQKRYNNSH